MRFLCLVAILTWLLPLRAIDAQTSPDHAASIRAARHQHNELLRTRQLDSAATFWTEDLVVLSSLGVRFDGPAAMRDAMERDTSVIYRRTPVEVSPSAHWPIAWERGTWVGVQRSDPSVTVLTGWYSARWLYVDGRWRIQSEQFVADTCRAFACERPLAPRRGAP